LQTITQAHSREILHRGAAKEAAMKHILIALVGIAAASATPYENAMRPYLTALAQTCPQKHLERLTAGDLDFGLDEFSGTLSARAKAALVSRQAPARAHDCAHSEAGLGCSNFGAIRVMHASERHAFVRFLCLQPVTCNMHDPCRLPGS
jgi:hypothetical protein